MNRAPNSGRTKRTGRPRTWTFDKLDAVFAPDYGVTKTRRLLGGMSRQQVWQLRQRWLTERPTAPAGGEGGGT